MDKFTKSKLEGADRPRFLFKYAVVGQGRFPLDMLRHDACWPASSGSAIKLDGINKSLTKVELASHREPTEGRWNSFGWIVERRY